MTENKISQALNNQLNLEHFSFYQYLSNSAYADGLGLSGISHWFRMQSREELFHADKIFNYMLERGFPVELKAIEGPRGKWKSIVDTFHYSLEHEKQVSASINEIVDLTIKTSDHASNTFLQWFVSEQVEEESIIENTIQKLELIKDDKSALLVLDKQLANRKAKSSLESTSRGEINP
jgi:ferritin